MDAVKFIKERNRMCKSFSPDCEGCRIDEVKPVINECVLWTLDNPEKAVQIVEEWSAAHPRKTRQDVFLEQWPEAKLDEDGIIVICPAVLSKTYRMYSGEKCPTTITPKICADCRRKFWMQEVE